jgi:hypothetical protein
MPEADAKGTKQFNEDVPQRSEVFFLKGSAAYDWGMQNRLARIFRPDRSHGDARHRSRQLPGPDDGAGGGRPEHPSRSSFMPMP